MNEKPERYVVDEDFMVVRDWFAKAAMQGMLGFGGPDIAHPDNIAQMAYDIADAMMKERANRQ